LITRIDYDEIPPKVEYSLTSKGEELSDLLDNMCAFSETIIGMKAMTAAPAGQ
jgi:DNA-binding HxlR family transcriptional regulator